MKVREFLKPALWAILLVAGAALAQEAAVSGADFTAGKADAQLGAIGKQAAASGKTVVITAPTYWQEKAAAKVRAGAHGKPVSIRFSNGFYENVLVRTEAAAPKPEKEAKAAAKPEAKVAAQPAAKPKSESGSEPTAVKASPEPRAPAPKIVPAPRVVAPNVAPAPTLQPTHVPPRLAPPSGNIVAVPQVSQQPEVVPIPTSAVNPTGVRPALPAAQADPVAAARQRLLAALNGARAASGELSEAQLQPGDQ
ncbi:MAG: hypothetical protein JSS21_02815, partial [Proteobacteria bacterium]|nr:hypothetical protein [Pseudomonadota bacterium]